MTRVRTPNPSGTGFTVTSTPFPGNQIPANRFNPASVYLLDKFAPLPNLPQTGLPNRNYQYVAKTPVDKDQFTGRIDFNESPSFAMVRPLQLDRRIDRRLPASS